MTTPNPEDVGRWDVGDIAIAIRLGDRTRLMRGLDFAHHWIVVPQQRREWAAARDDQLIPATAAALAVDFLEQSVEPGAPAAAKALRAYLDRRWPVVKEDGTGEADGG